MSDELETYGSTNCCPYEQRSDEELSIMAKGGDIGARNALFLRHEASFRKLTGRAKRIVSSFADRDSSIEPKDVDQQLFLIFCVLLRDWDSDRGPFLRHVTSSMPNRAVHYVRDTFKYRSRTCVARISSNDTDLETSLARRASRDAQEEVESLLAWSEHMQGLSLVARWWLALRFCQGMSSKQIAALSGCSSRTVARVLRSAIQSIRRSLQEGWEGCE